MLEDALPQLVKPATLKALLAELVGTLFLTLAALLSGTPYAVALTLTAFVYAIGNVSGCHINPAVTIGLVSARRLPVTTGVGYVLAQIAGALLARLAAPHVGLLAPNYPAAGPIAEFLGAGFLLLTVVAVSDQYVPKSGSGIAIGAALAAGLVTTKGILNPAVAIAMGQLASGATWAAVLGSVVFTALFTLYARAETKDDATKAEPAVGDQAAEEHKEPPAARARRQQGAARRPVPPGLAWLRAGSR